MKFTSLKIAVIYDLNFIEPPMKVFRNNKWKFTALSMTPYN